MNKKLIFAWIFILIFSPMVWAGWSFNQSDSPEKVKKTLTKVQSQIQSLEKNIYHSQRQERALQQQLSEVEKVIGSQSEKLRQLEQDIKVHQLHLNEVELKTKHLEAQTQQQQTALISLIEHTFKHYQQEKLRLFFSAQSSATLSRLNHYYHYFHKARTSQINTIQTSLETLQLSKIALEEAVNQKISLLAQLKQTKLELSNKKLTRLSTLRSLSQHLATDAKQLTALNQQSQHLEQAVKLLQKNLKKMNTPSFKGLPTFSKNLLAPLENLKAQLDNKHYFSAPLGAPVRAISAGRVVFSEWLRGVGLLLIVDHGNGYMSLYGSNQHLYKNLGDLVKLGETIARVGQSGGHANPGLYFEIRKDGRTINLKGWFTQT